VIELAVFRRGVERWQVAASPNSNDGDSHDDDAAHCDDDRDDSGRRDSDRLDGREVRLSGRLESGLFVRSHFRRGAWRHGGLDGS
jgi:hypothetical protein